MFPSRLLEAEPGHAPRLAYGFAHAEERLMLTQANEAGVLIDEEAELDRLYAAPLDQFIKLRNELAQRFRKEGERAIATRIGELKKPTVSAWAVNQLARARELDVQRLVKAGGALERAQRDAMSGGDASDFQAAGREEGAAIRRLVDAAETILPSASQSILDRVAKTLRAAAATSQGRHLVKAGRLAEDLEPPGFEALSGLAEPRSARRRGKSEGGRQKQLQRRIDTLRKKKQDAEELTKRTGDEAKELEHQARDADRIATKAKRLATSARKRADSAAAEARRLKDELTELERRDR